MTFVVPFDDSALSRAALVRAAQFDAVLEEGVLAVTVIPKNNRQYASDRGWIDATEPFDADAIVASLRDRVAELVPEASFEHVFVDRHARVGTIGSKLRRTANARDASIVFVGSENAGRIVGGITVGQTVAADRGFDTMIVSTVAPQRVEKLQDVDPSVEQVD